MIEGRDPNEVMGRSQVSALRDEFSRMTTVPWSDLSGLASPGAVTVTLAALTLVAFGVPGLPSWPVLDTCIGGGAGIGLGLIAGVSSGAGSRRAYRDRRWGSPRGGAGAAGLPRWAVWRAVPAAAVRVPGAARRGNRRRGAVSYARGRCDRASVVQRPAGVRYLDRDHRRR
jgi:hypothetical protein